MIKKAVRSFLKMFGLRLVRGEPAGRYYINARDTRCAAQKNNMSIRDYVEKLWDQEGCTEFVINEMSRSSCFKPCARICEIGPGTGRYLELVLQRVTPQQYDIYELADDWAEWLAATYAPIVHRQETNGFTLQHTPDGSCHLVHAHGVFVYLSLLNAYEYFNEMVRVCSPGGSIVFDFFSDRSFDLENIARWLQHPERYPVVLQEKQLVEFFLAKGFDLIRQFKNKFGHGHSDYLIFKKTN